jgi:hypothetical protein
MGGNIKIDVKATKWEGVNWTNLVQDGDRWFDFVNALMNLQFQ